MNFLLLIYIVPTETKSVPICLFKISERNGQSCLATTQLKNKWLTVSTSEQNKQVGYLIFFLILKLSLVRTLFLDNNHRKKWTLGGTFSAQTAGTNTGEIPLKLITLYKDWEEYTPWELNCHIKESSSSVKLIVEANWTTSNQRLYNLPSTHLLKVHFTSLPSQRDATVASFSLINA